MSRLYERDVHCLTCGALPGEPCRTIKRSLRNDEIVPAGTNIGTYHADRGNLLRDIVSSQSDGRLPTYPGGWCERRDAWLAAHPEQYGMKA